MRHSVRVTLRVAAATLAAVATVSCGPGVGTAQAHVERARALNAAGDELQAAAELGRALGVDPANREAHLDLGDIFLRRGLLEAAETEYGAALSIKEDLRSRYNLGMVALRDRRYQDALIQFEAAERLDPENSLVYTQLGIVYHQLGQADAALASFERALQLSPDDIVAKHNVGFGYRIAGRYDEAIATLEEVVREDPRRTVSLYELGMAYAENGQVPRAIAVLNRLLAIDPGHEAARDELERLGGGTPVS